MTPAASRVPAPACSARLACCALLALSVLVAPAPGRASCPASREALARQDGRSAEANARDCLGVFPDDPDAWEDLSRALALRSAFGEAIEAADRAIALAPGNAFLPAWRVRLLAWKGDRAAAREAIATLPEAALAGAEGERLPADVAFWSGDWDAAVSAYGPYLARHGDDGLAWRNRGYANLEAGNRRRGIADLRRACTLPEAEIRCEDVDSIQAQWDRFRVLVAGAWLLQEHRASGGDALAQVEYEPIVPLRLGVSATFRSRDYGAGRDYDVHGEAAAHARLGRRFLLSGGGGYTFHRRFSVLWTAWVEGGMVPIDNLEVYFKLWRIQYPGPGTNILSPAASWGVGGWLLYARYFLSVFDDASLGHAGMVKVAHPFGTVTPWVAGGAGDRTDFLELRSSNKGLFGFASAGVAWRIVPRHGVQLAYTFRNEAIDGPPTVTYRHHRFELSWQTSF